MKKLLIVVGLLFVLTACSTNDASSDYTKFCSVATNMDSVASGPHGEDPAAITDPAVMGDTWERMVTAAEELRDLSPDDVKSDVALVVSTLVDMNNVFKANNYDLVEMAKNEETRKKVDAISQREGVADASQRFNDFVEKNCSTS